MDTDRNLLQLGMALLLCAVLIYLTANGLPGRLGEIIGQEEILSALFFLQTGRAAHPPEAETVTEPRPTEPPEPSLPAISTPQPAVLRPADADAVKLRNLTGYAVDTIALLEQPLDWSLRGDAPTVLILHTHGTESYRNTEGYEASGEYRTEDPRHNVVSVGARLAACLEAGGIRVIHDTAAYDLPSYNGSYSQARVAVEQHLAENPEICLILDLHRDAILDDSGEQLACVRQTPRGTAAQLMLVSGSDAGGLSYPAWQQNLSLAVKLQAILERQTPGLCRDLSFRTGRYNQDLFPHMLLVEMGAAGNTRQEALLSAELLAEAVLALADGAVYQ